MRSLRAKWKDQRQVVLSWRRQLIEEREPSFPDKKSPWSILCSEVDDLIAGFGKNGLGH